jgi:hypothetical protein
MLETYHLSQMHGTRSRLGTMAAAGLCLAFVVAACGKSKNTQSTIPATPSSEEAEPRSSRPSRAEVACHLHSCAPPMFCNPDRGVCQLLTCHDSRDCPYGYKCDFSKNVCR